MTDDELDLIASAYLDGEATPEEVALVERDPALLTRVEEFRAISGSLAESPAPPPALAEHQLAAALAEFESLAADNRVVDLQGRAASRPRSNRRSGPARPQRSLPSWLPAAAVFLLLGGGVIWAAGRSGSDDFDSADSGSDAATDAGAESGDATAVAALDEAEPQMADEETASDEQASGEADTSRAELATEAADTEAEDDSGGDDSAEEGTDGAAPNSTFGAAALPPALILPEIPDPYALDDLPELERDLDRSRCGRELELPGRPELVGFVPLEIAGDPAELFVAVDEEGAELRFLVDGLCELLEP